MWASWSLNQCIALIRHAVVGRAAIDIRNKNFLQVISSEMVEQQRSAPALFLGYIAGSHLIVLRIFLQGLSRILNSVFKRHQVTVLYSRAKVVYSHRTVIRWRHPNLVPAQLRAKKEDHPKLMCCKGLLTVEAVVDLRIPRTTSNNSPLIVQEWVYLVGMLNSRSRKTIIFSKT